MEQPDPPPTRPAQPLPPAPAASPHASGYPYSPYQAARWQNPTGLAKAIRILLMCEAVILLFNVLGILYVRAVASEYAGGDRSDEEFFGALLLFIALALFSAGGQIAIAVCTIIWQWRLVKNTQLMGRPGATWGPGWAIAGWLIPVANLVIPYLQLRELWKGSDWRFPAHTTDWKAAPIGTALIMWELAWVGNTVLQLALNFTSPSAPASDADLDAAARSLADLVNVAIPSYLVSIAAAVLFYIVVQQLTERHAHAVALAATGQLGSHED